MDVGFWGCPHSYLILGRNYFFGRIQSEEYADYLTTLLHSHDNSRTVISYTP